jgi:hypothetical protein
MKPSLGCNLKGVFYTIGNALKLRDLYLLHFIFQYFTLVKKCKIYLVILRHCKLYRNPLLCYGLKMASRKPKYCSCYVPLINYILHKKLCWTINLYILLNGVTYTNALVANPDPEVRSSRRVTGRHYVYFRIRICH